MHHKFGNDTWRLFTSCREADCWFLFKKQRLRIQSNSGFAVLIWITLVSSLRLQSQTALKLGSLQVQIILVQHNLTSGSFFQVTIALLVQECFILATEIDFVIVADCLISRLDLFTEYASNAYKKTIINFPVGFPVAVITVTCQYFTLLFPTTFVLAIFTRSFQMETETEWFRCKLFIHFVLGIIN